MMDIENDPLESLATEFIQLVRAGENPSVSQYAIMYPELAVEIEEVFPTIASMEQVREQELSNSFSMKGFAESKLERLGDYRIIREIGRGGMGIVFLAVQESLGREVALKVLPKQCLLDGKRLQRFIRESRTAARLHHTNIVPVFGVGQEDGHHYYVMQHIEGIGIDRLLDRWAGVRSDAEVNDERCSDLVRQMIQGELWSAPAIARGLDARWVCAAQIGMQAAEALQYAHQQNVLHRDIKPGNILVDFQGHVWITDFGLAKAVEQSNISQTGEVLGTVRYMAPEQKSGNADARSDVFSLGQTLYELVGAQLQGDSRRPDANYPASLRSMDKSVPRDLDTIISKSIATNPNQRYQSAHDLTTDLRNFLTGQPIKARRISMVGRLMMWGARKPVAATTSCASVLLLVIIVGFISVGYWRETLHRQKLEAMSLTSTEILDRIYNEFAPRGLETQGPIESLSESDFSSTAVEQIPSKETVAVLENLLLYYDQIASQNESDLSVVLKAADANIRIGNMQRLLGNFEAAELAFRRSITLCKRVDKSGSPLAHKDAREIGFLVAVSWNELGQTLVAGGRNKDAQTSFENARGALTNLRESGVASGRLQFELAKTLYLLDGYGYHISIENNEPRETAPRSRKAAAILERLVETHRNPEYRLLLARCYRRISNYQPNGLPNVEDRRAQEVIQKLIDDFPATGEHRFEMAYTLNSCRIENLVRNEPNQVIARLAKARSLLAELVDEFPRIPHYQQLQVAINRQESFVFQRLDRTEQALERAERAVYQQQLFMTRFPDAVQHHSLMASLRLNLASAQFCVGQFGACFENVLKMRDEVTVIEKRFPNTDNSSGMWQIHQGLGELAERFDSLNEHTTATRIREIELTIPAENEATAPAK